MQKCENKCLDTVVLLQTFLGLGIVVGTLGFSCLVVNKSKQCLISPQYLLQISILGIGQLPHGPDNLTSYILPSYLLSEELAGVNTPLVCVWVIIILSNTGQQQPGVGGGVRFELWNRTIGTKTKKYGLVVNNYDRYKSIYDIISAKY